MLQRVQTVFLAIVILLGVAASFLSIMSFTGAESSYVMNLYKTTLIGDPSSILSKNMGVGVLQGVIQIVALILFFAINGHHWLINALVLSYKTVPITGVIDLGFSMSKIINLFNGLFVSAIKIAAPIMIVLGLVVVVSGFLARSTPEINIFLIIFPSKILIGFVLLAIMFPFITRAIQYLLDLLRQDIFSLVGGM